MRRQIYQPEQVQEKKKKISYDTTEDRKIEYSRKEGIIVAPSTSETKLAVRLKDLERIKKKLGKTEGSKLNLSIIYSILYGVAGSSGLSLIPVIFATTSSPWVIPLYVSIFIFSSISAVSINLIDYQQIKRWNDEENNTLEELEDMISSCLGNN